MKYEFIQRELFGDNPVVFYSEYPASRPDFVAEDASYECYYRHDVNMYEWPLEFEIFELGKSLGIFRIEAETDPRFKSTKVTK
ncbi:MAG: hypothetical protein KAS32_18935 [Candidatus Peribacteraceae bacterium]|nr:hypothetical protein [Candidatus Peribacteraceae bacterium]